LACTDHYQRRLRNICTKGRVADSDGTPAQIDGCDRKRAAVVDGFDVALLLNVVEELGRARLGLAKGKIGGIYAGGDGILLRV